MAEVEQLQESDKVEAYWEARRQEMFEVYRAEGREQARAGARADQRALFHRLAARRFGTDAAALLEKHLEGVDDSVRLTEVGDWIADCATGAELIERIETALWEARRRAMVEVYRAEGRAEGRVEGREQGCEEGREQGHAEVRADVRDLLRMQAVRRFGDDVEAPIVTLLKGIDDTEGLTEVGDWIVDYASGAELVERLQSALRANREHGMTTSTP